MVRLLTSGAESQNFATEGLTWYAGGVVFDTVVFSGGAVSYKIGTTTATNSTLKYPLTGALGVNYYARMYVRFQTTMPVAVQSIINWQFTGGPMVQARISATGKLQLWSGAAQLGSDSATTLVADTWYRIELRCKIGTGSVDEGELLLNSVQVAIATGQAFGDNALNELVFGWTGTAAANAYLNIDDVAINDDTGPINNGFPGAGITLVRVASPVTATVGTVTPTRVATPVVAALTTFDPGPWTPTVTFSGGGGSRTATPVRAALNAVGRVRQATPVTAALQTIGAARQATPGTASVRATGTRVSPGTAAITAIGTSRTATPVTASLQAVGAARVSPEGAALQTIGALRAATPIAAGLQAIGSARVAPNTAAVQTVGTARTAAPVTAALQAIGTSRTAPTTAAVQTGGTPTAIAISPSASSTTTVSVVFVWWTVPDGAGRALHSRLIAAASPATVNGDGSFASVLVDANSAVNSGFDYDTSVGNDGSGPWVAYPATGLTAVNQGRRARYTVTLPFGQTDWRVRLEAVGA